MAASDEAHDLSQIADACAELQALAVRSKEMLLAHLLAMAGLEAERAAARRGLSDGRDGSAN